tara:strand:+ start:68 stop:682 length:615 start_codon:yes stop_codon:yes gene_type:complete
VHSPLRLGITVSIKAIDSNAASADARLFPGLGILDLNLESATLSPTNVHPHEHIGPIAGFRATGAGMNAEQGGPTIEGFVQKARDLKVVDLSGKALQGIGELTNEFLVGILLRQFRKNLKVLDLGSKGLDPLDRLLKTISLRGYLASLILIVPESRLSHSLLQSGDLFFFPIAIEKFPEVARPLGKILHTGLVFRNNHEKSSIG